jgi:murein DD-endopeptidase MepM/ murein hydrolase activator NlpD
MKGQFPLKPYGKDKKVEKKFKFSENPNAAKILYGAVIALLCVTAIIVGIIAANNRTKPVPPVDNQPPVSDNNNQDGNGDTNEEQKPPAQERVTYISPVSGKVYKNHDTETPVYSETLEEWRIHTGIDISTAEGADVFASAAGEVTKVYSDALLGKTVEITHSDGSKTRYSNLSADGIISEGTTVVAGEKIGKVGDSAISEIADEVHLHFELIIDEAQKNPLDYISEESKKASLGIDTESEA